MYPQITTAVERDDHAAGFRSADSVADKFFGGRAFSQHAALVSRTWVLRRGPDDPARMPPIYGFYTLSVGNLAGGLASTSAVLMDHFVIHEAVERAGFGRILLADALARCLAVTNSAGALSIVATSRTQYGSDWLDRHDFSSLGGGRHFVPMALVARAFATQ